MTRQLAFFKLGIAMAVVMLALPSGFAVASGVALGAAIGFVANHCFARRVFAFEGSDRAGLLACLYRAECAKLLMAGTLFGVSFALAGDLNLPALLGGYLAVHLGTSAAAVVLDPAANR